MCVFLLNDFLNSAMCGLMSFGLSAAICVKKFSSVSSYLSYMLPIHVWHSMPFAFYLSKFSLRLSIIRVRSRGRPRRFKSFTNAPLTSVVCCRYSLCEMKLLSGSSLSRMKLAYVSCAAVKITIS